MLRLNFVLYLIWLIIDSCAVLTSLFGNSVAIYVLSKLNLPLKKTSYSLISISLSNLLFIILSAALMIFRAIKIWNLSNLTSKTFVWIVVKAVLLMLTAVKILQLLFVAVERYWAISYPVSYRSKSERFMKYTILTSWLIGCFCGVVRFLQAWLGKQRSMKVGYYIFWIALGACTVVAVIVLTILFRKAFLEHVS